MASSDSEFETDFLDNALRKTNSTFLSRIASKTSLAAKEPNKTKNDNINDDSDDEEDNFNLKRSKKAKIVLGTSLDDSFLLEDRSVAKKGGADKPDDEESVTPPGSPVPLPARGRGGRRGKGRRGRGRGRGGADNPDVRTKQTEAALRLLKSKKLNEERRRKREQERDEDDDEDDDESVVDLVGRQFSLKVHWRYEILRIDVEEENELSTVLARLSEMVGVKAADLELALNEKVLDPKLSVRAGGLGIASFVDLRKKFQKAPQEMELKFQTKDYRKASGVITLRALPNTKFGALMEQYVAATGVTAAKITFRLDGDALDADDTPLDHDLEGGECIDVVY